MISFFRADKRMVERAHYVRIGTKMHKSTPQLL